MSALQIVLGAVMLLVSIIIVAVILLQEGHRSGINGAISGGADTFLSKNKSRTFNATLARVTKYVAILFFVFSLVLLALGIKG